MSDELIPAWTLGDRLAKARQVAGLNISELAHALGISRNSVTNYERGHTTPNRAVLIAYSVETGVPLWWIEHDDHAERDTGSVTQREWTKPSWFLRLPKRVA